jgi:hypothetical protein
MQQLGNLSQNHEKEDAHARVQAPLAGSGLAQQQPSPRTISAGQWKGENDVVGCTMV